MRLAYYLLYANIDDEDIIVYLFQEELKDRKTNSFQGIGNTLNALTSILNKYNTDGRYDKMLEEAKNANFDCACGFDKNYHIDDKIISLNLMECIFLSQDLDYKDVMDVLVSKWKDSIGIQISNGQTMVIELGDEAETIFASTMDGCLSDEIHLKRFCNTREVL